MHALATLLSGRIVICSVLLLLVGATVASPAAAADPAVGYDISYPQCGLPLPTSPAFGIVGVNGGRAFTANPCLADQLAWAKKAANKAPAFYANTGNPGPAYTTRWPIGQASPRPCTAAAPNSSACSFDYGWNAAKDSLAIAARASQAVNGIDEPSAREAGGGSEVVARRRDPQQLADTPSGLRADANVGVERRVRALGAVRALWDAGVAFVGIYSTDTQWNLITGGSAYARDWFSANPVWLAGFTPASASSGCAKRGFTGAKVIITQYLLNGFDANYVCP